MKIKNISSNNAKMTKCQNNIKENFKKSVENFLSIE